ncbi:MAG: PQQ-binding-like beta-propeller repeat protein [Verrucomicrobiales bacterium]|nr:PQQ-binding-like beta-propeller repeat protein [Verrucomicrobiales bacterium]
MKKLTGFLFLLFAFSHVAVADWPQWRGPLRNGVIPNATGVPAELTDANEPTKVWESQEVPSDHYGGHGSVAVANGKVFVSVVWHRDEPTETRRIDNKVMSDLGYRGYEKLGEELIAKMEDQRMNLSRRLRGAALDEFSDQWVKENLNEKDAMSLGGWIASRFKKGKTAIPLSVFATLKEVRTQEFANQAEMEVWVKEQKFDPSIEAQIIAAVPDTKKVANDVVLCLDAETGDEVWKFEQPGSPSGRGSSSTPAILDGKVYAALSNHLYCVDEKTGEKVWETPLQRKGPASSPLVANGKVFLQQNNLTAYNAETGEVAWENKEARGVNQSPAVWKGIVICNAAKEVVGVNGETGETMWKAPGGGDGTPVVSGDHLVITSKTDDKNLIAYDLSPEGVTEKWSIGFLSRRYGSSPIIYDGNVYHLGSERHMCVDLENGKIQWERKAQSSISSPFIADGKLFVYENRGGFISMIQATPEDYTPLGRAKVGALYCASPAFVDGKLYFRTKDRVTCYALQ